MGELGKFVELAVVLNENRLINCLGNSSFGFSDNPFSVAFCYTYSGMRSSIEIVLAVVVSVTVQRSSDFACAARDGLSDFSQHRIWFRHRTFLFVLEYMRGLVAG